MKKLPDSLRFGALDSPKDVWNIVNLEALYLLIPFSSQLGVFELLETPREAFPLAISVKDPFKNDRYTCTCTATQPLYYLFFLSN